MEEKDKPKIGLDDPAPVPQWKISDKKSLVAWVSRFLWHYEGLCSDTGSEESVDDNPANIIVDNILKAIPVLKDGEKSETILLPTPAFYFQFEEGH
jgi:hypothetical protein